jgi:asparagine synthase (glutamine-hydrolysing)
MKAIAAFLDRKGGNAIPKIVTMLNVLAHSHADAYCIATPSNMAVNSSLEELSIKRFEAPIALGHVFVKVLAADKPQLTRFRDAILLFDGRIYNPRVKSLDVALSNEIQLDGLSLAEALIKKFDGCYAFVLVTNGKLIVGRDSLGLYPIYYGDKGDLLAAASERKALWKVGIHETKSLPPGHLLIADECGLQIQPVRAFDINVRPKPLMEATEELERLLWHSIFDRTADLNEVAVAFSGGLDSSLIAFLAKKVGVNVHLIHVSLENRPETMQAEEAAKILGLPLYKFLYHEDDVEQILPEVLWCIETPDPLKVSIALPLYWTAEKAAELGFKVLLTGQGADELFGGYKRYLKVYTRFGEEQAWEAITSDIRRMHEENFERDFKVCSFHNVELRLPLASIPLVEFALRIPLNLKIASKEDLLRKLILRKTAEKFGLPTQIVYKPKKAVQYATGVDRAIRKLAKKQGLSVEHFLQKIFESLRTSEE